MRFAIESLEQQPIAQRRLELIERKGLGHPDTICDSLVEAISCGLNQLYLDRLGFIPHYNIDKALLAAGQCRKDFGSGEVIKPMRLVFGDRATLQAGGVQLPVAEAARDAVDDWVRRHLPHVRPGIDLHTEPALAPGSQALRRIYADPSAVISANDTSGACGYAPLTPTERLVLRVEHFLNGAAFKRDFPDTGQDVKVFAVREDDRVALTVAMPLLCAHIESEAAYFRRKQEIAQRLSEELKDAGLRIDLQINALDQPGAGSEGVYLSHTGTSAEDADSGQVGRGNRVNGLIAFARPTGGEAAPGKNPVAHVGKIYSVLSYLLAQLIHQRCPEIIEVYVSLAVRIGEPVHDPWVSLQVVLPRHLSVADVEPLARQVVAEEMARMPQIRDELIRGVHAVC
jgi:S-adenosylmethionine synthetase